MNKKEKLMNRLPAVLIDPHLVCLPVSQDGESGIEKFVNGLLAWSDCLLNDRIEILISELCLIGLIEDGIYPYEHKLRDLLNSTDTNFVDSETISRIVLSVINATPYLEERYGIRYVISDNLLVRPNEILRRLPPRTSESYRDSLLILSVWHWAHDYDSSNCAIAAREIPEPKMDNCLVVVSARISSEDEIEWCSELDCKIPGVPADIEENYTLFESFCDVLDALGCIPLWDNGNSEDDARDAIDQRSRSLISSGLEDLREGKSYLIGSGFLESARSWGFTSARPDLTSNLIESCARIVLGSPKKPLRPFRKGKSPTSNQIIRDDGAEAFRTHLTKKGPGFRLMLWEHEDGTIEFANVGDKDELEII